jgi:hypothetical protein
MRISARKPDASPQQTGNSHFRSTFYPPPPLHIERTVYCIYQCYGAGAARSLIFLEEPQRDAAPAPHLLFNIGSYSKMWQLYSSLLVFPFNFITIEIKRNQKKKFALILVLTLVCLKKVGLVCSREGARAAEAALKCSPGAAEFKGLLCVCQLASVRLAAT